MEWYYAVNNERLGPVDHDTFTQLVQNRTVTANTLVWRAGMDEWVAYGVLLARSGPQPATAGVGAGEAGADWQQCVECGNAFPATEMLSYGDSMICATCKPVYFQRLREGAALPGTMRYGGFWIRFVAKFIDYVILIIIQTILGVLIGAIFGAVTGVGTPGDPSTADPLAIVLMLIMYVVSVALGIFYSVWFVGKWGATPGKMVIGLKIVRSNGEPVSYLRALGRYFAEMLNGFTLLIGYIMAAFDSEKRALHDHICDTRVIFVR